MQTWHYGYVMIFLADYIIASEDKSVLPGLRRLALEAAKGQSAVGSWGHGFAIPDGRLGGYGMMNSPGIPLTISLSLAIKAGVKDPEIPRAIELSARLLRFYIGKGAVPYGDQHPWIENHDDNGKCGMAAVLFQLLEEPQAAEFFSRMSVACHGPERDTGHTGNYFNMLWAMPGVARSGPQATGAWMKEFGSWYYDLARKWDGSFAHQGPPDLSHDSYHGWDCSGAFLLAYAMPLQKIALKSTFRGTLASRTKYILISWAAFFLPARHLVGGRLSKTPPLVLKGTSGEWTSPPPGPPGHGRSRPARRRPPLCVAG
jgi:hypothetical protein